ncbi:MAG: hypothetical protein ABI353_07770 [Isosphaeraceae bacterium]
MRRPRRNTIRQPEHRTSREAPASRSVGWIGLTLILFNLLGNTVRQVAFEWDGAVPWLDVLIVLAMVGLIVTVALAVRAASQRRNRIDLEPGPLWMSPMYDPWLDG